MKRVIERLNNMSFSLPKGWKVSKDKYNLMNGQGFINNENYLSESGEVVSLFEVHRDPDEFFEYYQSLVEGYNEKIDGIKLQKEFNLKFDEFSFPVYVLKGVKEPIIYIVQVFVNCGDRLGCFMLNINNYFDSSKDLISKNKAFSALAEILRTIE